MVGTSLFRPTGKFLGCRFDTDEVRLHSCSTGRTRGGSVVLDDLLEDECPISGLRRTLSGRGVHRSWVCVPRTTNGLSGRRLSLPSKRCTDDGRPRRTREPGPGHGPCRTTSRSTHFSCVRETDSEPLVVQTSRYRTGLLPLTRTTGDLPPRVDQSTLGGVGGVKSPSLFRHPPQKILGLNKVGPRSGRNKRSELRLTIS